MNNNINVEVQAGLTAKARTRLNVIRRIASGELSQKKGALELGISTRQLRRLQTEYRAHGSQALNSKRIGKPSNNRLSERVRQQAIFLMKHRYVGVGPTVGHRHLTKVHGLKLSAESLRKIMIEQGLWQNKSRKVADAGREEQAAVKHVVSVASEVRSTTAVAQAVSDYRQVEGRF